MTADLAEALPHSPSGSDLIVIFREFVRINLERETKNRCSLAGSGKFSNSMERFPRMEAMGISFYRSGKVEWEK